VSGATTEPDGGVGAAGYAAARHILSSPSIAARTAPYIDGGSLDWVGLAEEARTMSVGEMLLVQIAHDLLEPGATVGLRDVVRRLDGRAFDRVVEALRIARGETGWTALGLSAAA
jgi:hypothetical protein